VEEVARCIAAPERRDALSKGVYLCAPKAWHTVVGLAALFATLLLCVKTRVQLMTACSRWIVHVTNLTPPRE
jgi:hypothetical protein